METALGGLSLQRSAASSQAVIIIRASKRVYGLTAGWGGSFLLRVLQSSKAAGGSYALRKHELPELPPYIRDAQRTPRPPAPMRRLSYRIAGATSNSPFWLGEKLSNPAVQLGGATCRPPDRHTMYVHAYFTPFP
jgi:hypothetical protein